MKLCRNDFSKRSFPGNQGTYAKGRLRESPREGRYSNRIIAALTTRAVLFVAVSFTNFAGHLAQYGKHISFVAGCQERLHMFFLPYVHHQSSRSWFYLTAYRIALPDAKPDATANLFSVQQAKVLIQAINDLSIT